MQAGQATNPLCSSMALAPFPVDSPQLIIEAVHVLSIAQAWVAELSVPSHGWKKFLSLGKI